MSLNMPFKSLSPRLAIPVVLAGALLLGGCENMNKQSQRMLSGGAIGAASGVAVTVITGGCVACGAAVGGAVGTGVGYVVNEMEKK
ncbi:MAG: osmotically inducible lipoprotein OsmB [Paracoccaceae bacterium]